MEDSNQNITLKYEVELKPIWTNFDWSWTIITSSNITKSPTDIVIWSLSNGSYHIRYRITDIWDDTIWSSLTTDWKNIWWNDESVADIVVTSSYTMNTNSYFTNNFTQSKYNDVLISSWYVYISSNAWAIYKVPKDMQAQFLWSSTMSDFNRKFLLSWNINTYWNLYNTTKERALFNDPRWLAIDETNKYLYIADWGNNEIKRIDLTSWIVTLVAWSVTWIAWDVDNIWTDARLNNPFKLELSKDNSILYFTDYTNKKLKKIDLTNNNVSTLYTTTYNPYWVTLDKDNNILYFTDTYRWWLDWWNRNTSWVSTLWIRSYDIWKNQFSMVYRKVLRFWNYSPMDIYYDSVTKSIYSTYVWVSWNPRWSRTTFFIEKIDTVWMVGSTISSNWYNPGCSNQRNYSTCNYYWYREWYGTTSLYYTPNSITYDSDSKKILVSDYENRLIREINTRTYEAPINVAMQLYDIDGTTLGGAAITPKGNAFRIMTRISDADAVDSNRVEIEMKDIYTPFNWSGTFQTPYYYTTKWVNTDIYYTVWESQVIAWKSYHIRIRPVDVNWNTWDWKYYLWNNDVWVNWNTVSDEDITIGNFNLDNQYWYILWVADSNNNSYSNGVYVYAPDTKVSYKAYNYVWSNITNLYTDNQYVYFFNWWLFYKIDKTSGDMYYISNFPSLYSYTIDKTNNYIYWTDKTSIFRYDIIAKTHTKLTWTLSTTWYIEWSPWVAQFNLISSISLSENWKSLYIADTNNNRIRKLDLDISSATYLSTSLVLWSWLADSTKDVSWTWILANIYHPYNVFVSAWSNYLFVSSNDATYAKIYKLDIASNYWNIIRTNIPWISWFRNWWTDDKYVYFMISWEIYKMSTDINLPSQIKILSKHAAYQEWVNWKLTAYSDYYFDWDTLFFVDNYSKIRKINYKYTWWTRSIWWVVSSIIQRESDNATPISTWATTQSQTMYLLANYTYPYQFHLKTQIEIKELWVDFNGTGLIEWDWQFYDAGAKTMQAFLTNDDIQQYKNYHWRVRTVDSYWNISDWYNAFNNSEWQADFVVWWVKVWQTNIVPVRLPWEVRKIPLNTLESFNYSLVDNALDWSVKWFYYVAWNCIRYFDYKQFSANRYNYSYTNYTTDFFCNSTISTINWKLKFSIDKTKMYLHSALKVYQLDLTSKDFTLLAWSTSWDVNWVPSASSFSNITDVTQLNKWWDTRCMLVTDKWNNKVKIFPISWTPSSCKWLVNDGTDNGWVEDWYIWTWFDCLYQTKDTNWLYVNGWKLSTATKWYTAVTGGFTCINDTIDSEEAYYYTYEWGVIRNVSLQQLSSNTIIKSKITWAWTSWYFEWPKDYSKFTSITAMIRDPMNSRLYVNDAWKFRTVELNSTYAPTISWLSSTSFKTWDQITITGSYLIEIWYWSGSLPMSEVQNWNFYILMGDIRLAYSDILYWTDNEIKVKVPYWVKDGKMIIKTPSWMSNSINFAISNPPTIFDISPYSFHVWDWIIITWDYFWVKNASSKVEITYSWATTVWYKLMTINSWADNSINVTVPTEAVTWNIKVTTQYGSYTYNISILNWRPPAKPILKSPGNLTTAVSITPTLLTNAYYNIDNNSQQASEWVVIDRNSSSEVFHTPADTYNLTQITVPSWKLYKGKSYLWKVRFQDNKSNWSDWSDVRWFTTDTTSIVAWNMAPNTPTNISPVNNSTWVTVTGLNLSASAYQDWDTDPAKQTAQSSSFWQIRKLSSSYSYAVLSQTKSSDFSNFAVPNWVLQDSTWYCWRVNYTDWEWLASNYSPETCFATAWTTRATPPPTATNNTNTSGTYTIAPIVYDKPNKPSWFWVTLDNSSYTVNLASNSYTDSNIDSLSWSEDKLWAVEWEVLYYNNTDTTLTTDTDWFITDSVLANVNFSTAKKYRKIRQNCAVPENEGNVGWVCLLNYSIPYNILGLKWTYLVRERHMDEYNTWSDSSGIKKFYIDKIPTSSMFYWNIRSVANLSLNIIWNTNNMTYNWTSDTLPNWTPGDFKPIAQCSAASDYMRYTHCLVSGTKTYWYIIWQWTSKLKFEPIVSWNYKFNVNVSNWTVTKAKLLEVNVQK